MKTIDFTNLVCTSCENETGYANIVKAPVPVPVMKKSLASPSTAAYALCTKSVLSESRMWVYAPSGRSLTPAVLYEYQPTRSGQHARRFLEGFKGFLQTDGFSGTEP